MYFKMKRLSLEMNKMNMNEWNERKWIYLGSLQISLLFIYKYNSPSLCFQCAGEPQIDYIANTSWVQNDTIAVGKPINFHVLATS